MNHKTSTLAIDKSKLQKKLTKWALGIAVVFTAITAVQSSHAQVVEGVDDKVVQEIKRNAQKNMKLDPSQIDYIGRTDFPGMYLLMIEGYNTTILSDSTLSKIMVGQYVDVSKNQSIGAQIKATHYKITPSSFKTENMIVEKRGNAARKMYVFADANCGWCKKFDTDVLKKVNNVTIYTLPVTILQPGGETDKKVRSLLCKSEESQGELWSNLLVNKIGEVSDQSCAKAGALQANTELAKKNKFSGTPTIVFENGSIQVGAASLADIESKLNANSFKK